MNHESQSVKRLSIASSKSRSGSTLSSGQYTVASIHDDEFIDSTDSTGNSSNDMAYDELPPPIPLEEGFRRSSTESSYSQTSSSLYSFRMNNINAYDIPPNTRHITSKSKSLKQNSTRSPFLGSKFSKTDDIGYVQMVPETDTEYTEYMKMKSDAPMKTVSYEKKFRHAVGGFKNRGKTLQPASLGERSTNPIKAHTLLSVRSKPDNTTFLDHELEVNNQQHLLASTSPVEQR